MHLHIYLLKKIIKLKFVLLNLSKKTHKGCNMRKSNNIGKETYSGFCNMIRRDDLSESAFINWMNELHKDLSSFWEKMNQ